MSSLLHTARLALLLLLVASAAHATITAPTLHLRSVESTPDAEGALLRVQGTFPFPDLVQRDYPLQLFVREAGKGTRFICFSVRWGAMGGDDELVRDGLDSEVAVRIGGIAEPIDDARIVGVSPGSIEVQLPPDWPPGLSEVQLFVFYEWRVVFSNPIPFALETPEEAAE